MLQQKVDGRLVRRGEDLDAEEDAAAVLTDFFKWVSFQCCWLFWLILVLLIDESLPMRKNLAVVRWCAEKVVHEKKNMVLVAHNGDKERYEQKINENFPLENEQKSMKVFPKKWKNLYCFNFISSLTSRCCSAWLKGLRSVFQQFWKRFSWLFIVTNIEREKIIETYWKQVQLVDSVPACVIYRWQVSRTLVFMWSIHSIQIKIWKIFFCSFIGQDFFNYYFLGRDGAPPSWRLWSVLFWRQHSHSNISVFFLGHSLAKLIILDVAFYQRLSKSLLTIRTYS